MTPAEIAALRALADRTDNNAMTQIWRALPTLLDEVERLRGALRGMLSAMPKQMATVADADRLRPHVDRARRVLGDAGEKEEHHG